MKPMLSFLIPAYNDDATIALVIAEADRVGREVSRAYEIVVIDDASSDNTLVTLSRLGEAYPSLRVHSHTKNLGYGATIRELYLIGKNEWLFTIPGDYQIGAAELRKLLPYTDRADMIIGLRKDRHDPASRLRQSRVYNSLLQYLFGITLHDINSVRLVRAEIMRSIKLSASSAFVDAEFTIRAVRAGFRVIEAPIAHRRRKGNRSGGGGSLRIILPTMFDLVRFRLGFLS